MATVADIRRIAPEFASVSDADVQGFLDDTALQLSASFWSSRYDLAHARLAAHLLSESHPELATPVQESAGDLSRTYAPTPTDLPAEYRNSRHGIQYWRLLKQVRATPWVI